MNFLQGFILSASLIIAIGAQNLFLLRQGLLKQHIFWVASVCVLCDAALMFMGIFGVGHILKDSPILTDLLTLSGVLFLGTYALLSLKRVVMGQSFIPADGESIKTTTSKYQAILATLAVTLLNPHVYIDTLMLIGGVAIQLTLTSKYAFFGGAMTASILWFYSLGYGARLLRTMFKQSQPWVILDIITFGVMGWLSIDLSTSLLNNHGY